jgi:hypothetical protein
MLKDQILKFALESQQQQPTRHEKRGRVVKDIINQPNSHGNVNPVEH